MFNLELSMKRESNSVKFGYPTLIWLQDYLNLENSFFKGNYLLSKASSIAPNMPSCFLRRHIWLAKVFQKSRSPPSKGFLDLTPHKFKSITQKSEQKYFKLFFYFGSCFFSVISTFFNFFPAAICCRSPDLITRTVLVFMNMLLLFFAFFDKQMFLFVLRNLASTCLGAGAGVDFKVFPMAICSCIVNPPL